MSGLVIWMTGLSGAGKTTLCLAVRRRLNEARCSAIVLDGDEVRAGLCSDLGFSGADRSENVRRVASMADLLARQGFYVLVGVMAPTEELRHVARSVVPGLVQVYVKASLATCEGRDVKGLYQKARRGEIADFTGVGAPFEEPAERDVVCDTEALPVGACVDLILREVRLRDPRIQFDCVTA